MSLRSPLEQRWPHLLAALFVGYVILLLWSLFASQSLLRDASDRRLIADSQRRAAVIADFLLERKQNTTEIAESREINDFLINQALGMSMEYGLNLNLDAIEQRLGEYLATKTLRGLPVFSSIGFNDEAGNVLASAGDDAFIELDKASPALHMTELRIDEAHQRYQVSAPVIFRGEYRGSIVANGTLQNLSPLLIGDPDAGDAPPRYLELLIAPDGLLVASPPQTQRLDPEWGRKLALIPASQLVPAEGLMIEGSMLALRSPIPDLPLSIVTLIDKADAHSKTASPAFLASLAAFPLVLLLGALSFERLRRRAAHLSVAMAAVDQRRARLEDDNALLAAEVGQRKAVEEALRQSQQRLKEAQRMAHVGNWEMDLLSGRLSWSEEVFRIFELSPDQEDASYKAFMAIVHPEDRAALKTAYNRTLATQQAHATFEHRILFTDGRVKHVRERCEISFGADGHPLQLAGTVQDITESKAAEARLEEKTTALIRSNAELQQLATVFTHAREGISITAADGTILNVNDAFCRLTGYDRDELIGQNPRMLKSGIQDPAYYEKMWAALSHNGHWTGEIWNRRKDGALYAELLTISAVCDERGFPKQYVALFTDITAQKEQQQQLEHIAHYDALTGLPNRSLLADRLQQTMSQAIRRQSHIAVAYLDLDGFKAVNDTYGHHVGDRLLIVVANRMRNTLREGDTLARLGGDEFVAVLVDLPGLDDCEPTLRRLLGAAADEVTVDDLSLRVSASLGVTFFPQPDTIDAEQLLRQADQAMYQAKLAGKNRYHVFDTAHDRAIRGRHESLERIRQGLTQEEFVLHYQPKVNMRSGLVVGVEALIRWAHPQNGLMAPLDFLPIIEDHPLAVNLGDWVLNTALAQADAWRRAGLNLAISVNVSARQLQQPDFVSRLAALVDRHGKLATDQLELEVLETSALEDITQVSKVIEDCLSLGILFALDDFGTGYSSLTYLKRLPAHTLKIDRSFVRDMLEDPDDLAILEGILGLASAFQRQPIAEGVETVTHGEMLLDLGCELGQGYAIARPMPAALVPQWVESWRPPASWLQRPRIHASSPGLRHHCALND
jgi:diguanylate cyclase (GGDEF)-like protein/PAS domain S-box-containing protein